MKVSSAVGVEIEEIRLTSLAYWYKVDDDYVLCGNATGSVSCPSGYVCWRDLGEK